MMFLDSNHMVFTFLNWLGKLDVALAAVKYMSEISLILTLNNQFTLH